MANRFVRIHVENELSHFYGFQFGQARKKMLLIGADSAKERKKQINSTVCKDRKVNCR
ncbi:MAG: hypothetical protein ABIK28_24635 [Planctomycetota bacterium]